MKIVRVASAFIYNPIGNTMLMAQRPLDVVRPGTWENPGGKLDPGETFEQALVREVREELGVESTVHELISAVRLDLEVSLVMRLYRVTLADGVPPQPLASQQLTWVQPQFAVERLTCSPATYLYYKDIAEFIKRETADNHFTQAPSVNLAMRDGWARASDAWAQFNRTLEAIGGVMWPLMTHDDPIIVTVPDAHVGAATAALHKFQADMEWCGQIQIQIKTTVTP